MKRPILIATIGYILGILWELYIQISIVPLFFILILIFVVALKINKEKMLKVKNIFIIILVSMLISNFETVFFNNRYNNLYSDLDEIEVIATIVSDKKEKEYNNQYKIKVEKINGKTKYRNTNLLLTVKKNKEKDLKFGDKIVFYGKYIEPDISRNYRGFDYKEYLKTIKVYGSIKTDEIKVIGKNNVNIIELYINNLKNKIKENVNKNLSKDNSSVCLGILLGETDNLDDNIKEKFKSSSLYHILAVSGTHISYLIIGVTYLLQKSKIPKKIGKILTIIILIFFMILTGLTPSVFRAGTMGIILICASLFYKKQDFATSISLSLLISLINNPFCINNIGLQLSYGGTIGIVLFEKKLEGLLRVNKEGVIKYVRIHKAISYIKQMIAVSTSAQIIIIPIMILNFNIISLTFFISNILTGFLIGIIVIYGYILITCSLIFKDLAIIGFTIYNFILNIFLFIVDICSKIPFSKVYVVTPNILIIFMYYFIILGLRFNIIKFEVIRKYLKQVFVVFLMLALIFNLIKIIPSDLKIYFIDVGQGDSTLIVTPTNKKILVDTGGSKESEGFDVGKNTLVPYLLNRGVNKLEYVIISHFDSDHCNGFIAVLDCIKVDTVIISKQAKSCNEYEIIIDKLKQKNIHIQVVKKGDLIKFDKYVHMNILYPTEKLEFNDINSNSIVGKLEYGNFSMLFTGDIEKETENKILNLYKDKSILKSTILKVAHHGSKTSSTNVFLERVKPKYVVIGVGKNNTFGHPSDITIENLKNIGCKIYRTDENGEITIRVNEKGKIWIDRMIN